MSQVLVNSDPTDVPFGPLVMEEPVVKLAERRQKLSVAKLVGTPRRKLMLNLEDEEHIPLERKQKILKEMQMELQAHMEMRSRINQEQGLISDAQTRVLPIPTTGPTVLPAGK